MANVNIKFNGKEFLLSCDDGQEDHLEELSIHLNKKFENLKKKFLEIKKLVYEYKDVKEAEIKNLLNNHQDLKSEIDKTKLDYEKVLDEATSEIDKFIEKVNQDNSVQ